MYCDIATGFHPVNLSFSSPQLQKDIAATVQQASLAKHLPNLLFKSVAP